MPAALITKLETSVALSDDDRQSIALAAFKRRSVPARQDICRENEPSDGVIVVLDGFAARFRSLQSGKRQIVGYGLPGVMGGLGGGVLSSAFGLASVFWLSAACALVATASYGGSIWPRSA